MKWIIFTVIIYFFLVKCSPAVVPIPPQPLFNFSQIVEVFCGTLKSSKPDDPTVYDLCLNESASFNIEKKSESIIDYFNQVNSNYTKHLGVINTLKARVSTSQPTLNFSLKQEMDSLEITGQSGHLFLTDEDNGNSINSTINLDPSISSTNWTSYKILDQIINETKTMERACNSTNPIIENQIVWINQSVSINGSCCMIANISLAPGQQIITTNLSIVTDDGGWLDGAFTWGFIHRTEIEPNITGQVTFTKTLKADCLDSPSIDLTDAVIIDKTNTFPGNIHFNQLEVGSVEIGHEDNATNHFSLLEIIPIDNQSPYELCFLNFSQIRLIKQLDETHVSGVDLSHLLTVDTDQTLDTTIKINVIQLDGSQLSDEHEFAEKMKDKFSKIIASRSNLNYNNLTFDGINVTNLTTTGLDYLVFTNLNETVEFNDDVSFNGSVNFSDRVNGLHWDNDLIHDDREETIDSKLIFTDELIMSDNLANDKFKSIPMDNWLVEGDLNINGQFNNRHWYEMVSNLVHFKNQTTYLNFIDSVEASDCNFNNINDLDTSDFMLTRNISHPLTFKDLQIENLILNEVNVTSCLHNDQIVSDESNPIDQLNIINLQAEGTINEIEPTHFLINGSGQDFTGSGGSLMLSNVSFNHLVVLNDCETPEINTLALNRLLRADPHQEWPETVILKSCNITNFTNAELVKSLSNLLFNHSDQIINSTFTFAETVVFTNVITILNPESSINFQVDFGHEGDIYWDKLNVYGDLIINNLYDLNKMTNVTIGKGVNMTRGIVVNQSIGSSETDIYKDSTWKVHSPSTITSARNLTVDHLEIEQKLIINNDKLLPWLTNGSLDGIEYYSNVTLDNLTTNFGGNLSYHQMKAKLDQIKLEDIIDSSSGYLSSLQFNDEITIKENFTTNSDVDMNLVKIHV